MNYADFLHNMKIGGQYGIRKTSQLGLFAVRRIKEKRK